MQCLYSGMPVYWVINSLIISRVWVRYGPKASFVVARDDKDDTTDYFTQVFAFFK